MANRGKYIVRALFAAYSAEPRLMPSLHAHRAGTIEVSRAVGDYLAGMTDRLAVIEHGQLFQTDEISDTIVTSS